VPQSAYLHGYRVAEKIAPTVFYYSVNPEGIYTRWVVPKRSERRVIFYICGFQIENLQTLRNYPDT